MSKFTYLSLTRFEWVFYYPLAYQNGKVYVPERGKNQNLMPPIRIGETIIGKLKELW